MGLRSLLRRKALDALLEGVGVRDEKLRSAVADAVNKHLLEGFLMKIKPGWKTTEFWLSLLTTVAALSGSIAGVIPGHVGGIVAAISTAAYNIARGLAKQNTTP